MKNLRISKLVGMFDVDDLLRGKCQVFHDKIILLATSLNYERVSFAKCHANIISDWYFCF